MNGPITYITSFYGEANMHPSSFIVPVPPKVFINASAIMKEHHKPECSIDERTSCFHLHGTRVFVYKDEVAGQIVVARDKGCNLFALLSELGLSFPDSEPSAYRDPDKDRAYLLKRALNYTPRTRRRI